MVNSRDLGDLREDVRANCEIFLKLCNDAGLKVLITQTLRDNEYQAKLYAQGRTTYGNIVTNSKTVTFHGVGLAFDICKNLKGHEYDDAEFFKRCAVIGKKVGFTWGGDWTAFVDKPHFQWDEFGTAKYTSVKKMPNFEDVRRLQSRANVDDNTIRFLYSYKYAKDLFHKLAKME